MENPSDMASSTISVFRDQDHTTLPKVSGDDKYQFDDAIHEWGHLVPKHKIDHVPING